MKRFTETTKWTNNPWFRQLPVRLKCLWDLLCSTCDPAGVIQPDWAMFSFQIGEPVSDDDLTHFAGRIAALENGKLWLTKFIDFQHGDLSPDCKPHKPILKSIETNRIPYRKNETLSKGYTNPLERVQEKEEVKDKGKEPTEEGSGEKPTRPPHDPVAIVALYPRRQGVQDAVTAVARAIAAGEDPQTIIDGTRAIAAAISQMPSGHLNAYVPGAASFFQRRLWTDEPQAWLRNAAPGGGGGKPDKLSLGGRTGTTIRIGS